YYKYLQAVRDQGDWETWILYLLEGIEETAKQSIVLIHDIRHLMQQVKNQIRTELPKIYSQDLLNNLFRHPYTKIEFVMQDLRVSRPTASNYLTYLADIGILNSYKLGRSKYYVNQSLIEILINAHNKE
ncbi:MAG: Fic family protein, partial [Bacteroidota bacterium]